MIWLQPLLLVETRRVGVAAPRNPDPLGIAMPKYSASTVWNGTSRATGNRATQPGTIRTAKEYKQSQLACVTPTVLIAGLHHRRCYQVGLDESVTVSPPTERHLGTQIAQRLKVPVLWPSQNEGLSVWSNGFGDLVLRKDTSVSAPTNSRVNEALNGRA